MIEQRQKDTGMLLLVALKRSLYLCMQLVSSVAVILCSRSAVTSLICLLIGINKEEYS